MARSESMDEARLNLEFGSRLRERRQEAGMSQETLAETAGLSRTSVVNIEKGRQGVSLGTLYRLANALACDCADLLPPPPEGQAIPEIDLPRIAIGDERADSRRAVMRIMQRAQEVDR
jgi:transcriptional regulator with XRE-family HTH domain